MKKLLEIIDEVAKEHGLEWYKPHSAEPIKKSSDPLAPLIQQAKANLAAVHKVASQEPRPMLFGGKNGSGRHGFVSLDPSKPNQWRVTHFVKGKPSGHTEADSFSDAIEKAHSYGYNVSKELSEEDMSKTEDLEKNTNKISPSFAHIKNIDNFDDFTQSVKKLPETTKKEIINYQEEYNKNPPLSSNEELYYHGTPFFNEIKEGGFKNTEGGRAGFLGFVHKVQNLGNYFSNDKRLAHYYGSDRASHHTNNSNNYEVLSVKVNKGNCLDLTEPKVKIPTAIKKLGLKKLQQYDGLLRSHFIRGKDMVVLLDDPDFVKSLTNHGYDSVKFKEDKGILKNANSSGHTLFVMNPNKLKVHKPIRTLRDMFNHFKELFEEDMEQDKMKKSEDFSRVSSVVVATDDKMLMLQRRDNNKWTFPGGHLNDTETHLEGAVRELWEEAGIRANPDEMILLGNKKTFQNKDIHVYLYKVNSEVKPSAANDPDKEAQKFAWLPHVLPEDIKENLYIPVGDNSSLSLFSVWLLRQKTNKLKKLVEAKKSV
jgi:8-oxo-dGTP pyrophosphatase MutT (NUDIX family)